MKLNGSEIIVECLKEQKVDTVFGYPGGAILNVYDALYMHRDEIHHVLVSHEQGAAHAADGYARASGRVGVCFATSGPGATNLVTGIATAYMDSSPVVAITCNVGISLLGKDSFQEVDIAGITMPITKHNFIVKDIADLAPTIRRAFRLAKSGRPGPVLVDIPKNITQEKYDYKKEPEVLPYEVEKAHDKGISMAAELIKNASKPVIFVGGGAVIAGAQEEVRALSELIDAPVCDSLMGKGAFDGTSHRYLGMLGMHGSKAANLAVSECDLLIALGTRFSDRVIGDAKRFAKKAKILQFDVDLVEINKNIFVDAYVLGDLSDSLKRALPLIEAKKHPEWMNHIKELSEKYPLTYDKNGLCGPYIMEEIFRATKGEAVIVTEVGQHQMWAAQFYRYKRPRMFITSGGLGTMGFGLGAANGVKAARPEDIVVNISGDGCFRMNMHELLTSKREGYNIIEVIVNNSTLGMVRQWQELFYEGHYSSTLFDDGVDYAKIAEAMGIESYTVDNREDFSKAFTSALKAKGPVLIDARVTREDKVWPMVAPGAPIYEAFTQEDIKKEKKNG